MFIRLLWLLAVLSFAPAVNRAENAESAAEPDVDEELLDFLGSVDSEDEDWIDYLSHTDVKQVAKAKDSAEPSRVNNDE